MHGNNASQEFNAGCTRAVPENQDAWHFRLIGARERPHIKRFIASAFAAAYGARLQSFMPQLAALQRGDLLVAACGLRPAFDGRLFLENYLDGPIERALAEVAGRRVERGELVEVGNLAIARAGAARALITHLTEHLVARGVSYVVCTIVPALSNNFARLGIPLHRLADARVDRLPPPLRTNWGTYYEHKPVVTAIGVADAANALRVAR